jgi:hypothetical protein
VGKPFSALILDLEIEDLPSVRAGEPNGALTKLLSFAKLKELEIGGPIIECLKGWSEDDYWPLGNLERLTLCSEKFGSSQMSFLHHILGTASLLQTVMIKGLWGDNDAIKPSFLKGILELQRKLPTARFDYEVLDTDIDAGKYGFFSLVGTNEFEDSDSETSLEDNF